MTPSAYVHSWARILWEYHFIQMPIESSDFILALGSHDERVAEHAAEVFNRGLAPLLVTTGGFGKVTQSLWNVPEAEQFALIAKSRGVPESAILVEPTASNTGENISRSRELLAARNLSATSGILVTKPYMCRRALATAEAQWPGVRWSVTAPPLTFSKYPNDEVPEQRMIELMVGDLQRIDVYARRGLQSQQVIPDTVWRAYEGLVAAGYDQYLLKEWEGDSSEAPA